MSEFKHIVRVAGRDIIGKKKVALAIADLKGVGVNMAYMILNSLKIDSRIRFGALNDDQIAKIENSLKDLSKLGIPSWALNRRKNIETGSDIHVTGADLQMTLKRDIDRERILGSWRGVRHSLGLKVRGQRTRCTGRKGRSVGVRKTVRAPARV
jgi:small subunit ribosomal protein S13